MALKPRKKRDRRTEVDESAEKFLLTGQAEPGTLGHDLKLSRFFDDNNISEIWREHGDRLKKKWAAAGITQESWVEDWIRHRNDPYQYYLDEKQGRGAI